MRHLLAAAFLALSACSGGGDPAREASVGAGSDERIAPERAGPPAKGGQDRIETSLSSRLDCLRTRGGVLLIGHRGGPTRDYPENAIETFQRAYEAGVHAVETDIAETRDGVLVLMHDEDLARTTTGKGLVSDHTLAEIQALKLEAPSGPTRYAPPTLEAALNWAVKTGTILELDKKKSASWAPILAAVRAARAENNVLLVTYTDDQAREVHTLAPEMIVAAAIDSVGRFEGLVRKGVRPDHLIAWTGAARPDPALWRALAERGVEAAFGTLGPRASSLDSRYWEDGDGSEYNDLVADGLAILVTDLTDKTARQLSDLRKPAAACGL